MIADSLGFCVETKTLGVGGVKVRGLGDVGGGQYGFWQQGLE